MSSPAASAVSRSPLALAPPRPTSPLGGAVEDAQAATFFWLPVADARAYTVEVARDRLFQQVVVGVNAGPATQVTVADMLPAGATLYWRVRAETRKGTTRWSPYGRFVAGSDAQVADYKKTVEARRQQQVREARAREAESEASNAMLPLHERPDLVPSDSDVKLAISLFVLPITFVALAYMLGRLLFV
jgi:hypothetical protein